LVVTLRQIRRKTNVSKAQNKISKNVNKEKFLTVQLLMNGPINKKK
jgi:hypothetical protein